jgi:hypothetical protein
MIDVIFPKRAPTPRERETRPIPNDYRPRQLRAVGPGGAEGDAYYSDDPGPILDGVGIDLERLGNELSRNRLNEIATLVRSLTYGEMIEFARAIWRIRPEGAIDQSSLPTMLHLWSISCPDGAASSSKPSGAQTIEQ